MRRGLEMPDVFKGHILRYAVTAVSGVDIDEAALDEAVGEGFLGFAHRHAAVERQLGSVVGVNETLQRHLVELTPLVVDDTHLGLSVEEIVEEMTELADGHLVGDAQQLFNLFVFHIIFHCFPDNIVTFSEISFLFHTCISFPISKYELPSQYLFVNKLVFANKRCKDNGLMILVVPVTIFSVVRPVVLLCFCYAWLFTTFI